MTAFRANHGQEVAKMDVHGSVRSSINACQEIACVFMIAFRSIGNGFFAIQSVTLRTFERSENLAAAMATAETSKYQSNYREGK